MLFRSNSGIGIANQIVPIFGTTRLDAWGGLQGTLCFSGVTPGGVSNIEVDLSGGLIEQLTVSFTGPATNPTKITPSPTSVAMTASDPGRSAQTTLAVGITDKTKSWTVTVFPANRSTAWLSLSQVSGTGPGQITLTARAAGYEPGAYRANIVLQSPDAVPQVVNVPVMLVVSGAASGAATAPTLISLVNPSSSSPTPSSQPTGSPGALMTIYGTNLASAAATAVGSPLPYSLGGVSATVNGMPAPLLYVAPGQVNLQIPYSAGMGPSVVGIESNGQAGGLQFQLAPVSPTLLVDADGNAAGTVPQGGSIALYVNAVGEVSYALKTGYTPPPTLLSGLPSPVAPISVTIAGVPCFVVFNGITPGLIGVTQVNATVPASVPVGRQPVVVTAGGVPSPAGFVTVTAAP